MRVAVALVLLAGVALAGTTAVADNGVTTELSDASIKTLAGCWKVRGEPETWTFNTNDAHGLVVVRELRPDASEARRARIPQPVMFSTKDNDFAFAAAGRIHGLMVIFRIDRDVLHASFFTSHDGHSYMFTGNNVVAEHCAR